MASEWLTVGKIKDAHGIRGELFALVFSGNPEWVENGQPLQLATEEGAAPERSYRIKSSKAHKNGFILKLDEVKSRNQAEELKGLLIQVSRDRLSTDEGENPYLFEFQGARVHLSGGGLVGEVTGFASHPGQDLLEVQTEDGKELLIPLVDEFIESFDRESKTLVMVLPEGLLDLAQ